MKPTIEVEYRSLITESQFLKLRDFLNDKAQLLGQDNKDTLFYIWSDKVIKVVENANTGKVKISLKPGRIGEQSYFHETELTILPNESGNARKFCEALMPEKIMQVYQFRTNYMYLGVEIALKYTESWGFHLEFEVMIDDLSKKSEAEALISKVANILDVGLLSEDQLKQVVIDQDQGKKYGNYSDADFPY